MASALVSALAPKSPDPASLVLAGCSGSGKLLDVSMTAACGCDAAIAAYRVSKCSANWKCGCNLMPAVLAHHVASFPYAFQPIPLVSNSPCWTYRLPVASFISRFWLPLLTCDNLHDLPIFPAAMAQGLLFYPKKDLGSLQALPPSKGLNRPACPKPRGTCSSWSLALIPVAAN
jgi:hypothetical protein